MQDTMRLDWGRRYLLCPPDHFRVAYAINPWMGGTVDPDRAQAQWQELVAALRLAGAEVEVLPPDPAQPDMVFTANAAIVDGNDVLLARMRHPERAGETAHVRRWALAAGHGVSELPPGVVLEGIGDCLPLEGALVAGHGIRSGPDARALLASRTGRPVVGVHLTDPRWYHVDLTLCPLGDGRAIVYPDAWDGDGARQVRDLVREPLVLTAAEAATFCANSVVVGSTIIMPDCPPRVGRHLEVWGYDVVVVDVGEFRKAGGAVRCLTLPLDTVLSVPALQATEAGISP